MVLTAIITTMSLFLRYFYFGLYEKESGKLNSYEFDKKICKVLFNISKWKYHP